MTKQERKEGSKEKASEMKLGVAHRQLKKKVANLVNAWVSERGLTIEEAIEKTKTACQKSCDQFIEDRDKNALIAELQAKYGDTLIIRSKN